MKPIKTKFTGVFYRESTTNNKPDKTYYITYKDTDGKKHELKIGKFSEGIREVYCNQKRNEIITKQRLGEQIHIKHSKKDRILLCDLAEQFFEAKSLHNRNYKRDLAKYKKHIEPIFGSLYVEQIKTEQLRKLQSDKSSVLSPKTINNITDLFHSIIQFAIDNDKITCNNPLKKIDRFSIDNERERYLTKEEVTVLLDEAKKLDFEIYLFCLLSVTTGGRLETILSVREFDCDFGNRTVNLKDFKNNSTYKGFLTEEVIHNIKQQLKNKKAMFTITKSTLQHKLNALIDSLFNKGLKKDDRKNRAVIHTLRHTFASHLAINHTPIFTIQKLMNHSDIKMTMRYAKLDSSSGRDFVDKLFVA